MPQPVSLFAKRPLADWIDDLQHAQAAEVRYRALLAIHSLEAPPRALPWCRKALQDADSSLRALAAKQLGEMKRNSSDVIPITEWPVVSAELTAVLRDPDPDVRFEAARALGRIDPAKSDPKSVLLSLLYDDQTQPLMAAIVVAALSERQDIDAATLVPRYRKLIGHDQAELRESVSAAIVRLGSDANQFIPELVTALEDDEPIVRENAAMALGQAGRDSTEVQTALQTAELDEDEGVAKAARAARAMLS